MEIQSAVTDQLPGVGRKSKFSASCLFFLCSASVLLAGENKKTVECMELLVSLKQQIHFHGQLGAF